MSEESCMMQGLSLQSQPSPPAEGLGLLGLPEHLLGRIFSCIDGQEWAHNFYSSCRAIRDSPSVNQAIHAFDLELAGPPLLYPHPLQNWPRRATLKKLSVDARADGDAKQCALVNFLGPLCLTEYEGVDLKRVCRTVEHLSMEGLGFSRLLGPKASEYLPTAFPSLTDLTIWSPACQGLQLSSWQPLSGQLKTLELYGYRDSMDSWAQFNSTIRDLAMFSNLQSLNLCLTMPLDAPQEPLDLTPLADLKKLREFDLCQESGRAQVLLSSIHALANSCTGLQAFHLGSVSLATSDEAGPYSAAEAAGAGGSSSSSMARCVWPSLTNLGLSGLPIRDMSLLLDASFPSLKKHCILLYMPYERGQDDGDEGDGGDEDMWVGDDEEEEGGEWEEWEQMGEEGQGQQQQGLAAAGGPAGGAAGAAGGQQGNQALGQDQQVAVAGAATAAAQTERWDLGAVREVCTRLAAITSVPPDGCNLNLHSFGPRFHLTDGLIAALQPLGPKLTGMVLMGASLQAGDAKRLASVAPNLMHLGFRDGGNWREGQALPAGLLLEAYWALPQLRTLVVQPSVGDGGLMALCVHAYHCGRGIEVAVEGPLSGVHELGRQWTAIKEQLCLMPIPVGGGPGGGGEAGGRRPGRVVVRSSQRSDYRIRL